MLKLRKLGLISYDELLSLKLTNKEGRSQNSRTKDEITISMMTPLN